MKAFLYGQTEYNLLRSSMHLDEYIDYSKKYGYELLSITDNNLIGSFKFYNKCISNGIKPLIGLEIKLDLSNEPILLYALTNGGYYNLCRISSKLEITHELDLDYLINNSKGLLFITNSVDAYLKIKDSVEVGLGVFKDNDKIYDYAIKNGISVYPLVNATYLISKDRIVYETLTKIGGTNASSEATYLPSIDELTNDFSSMPKVFESLDLLASRINIDLNAKKASLPKYPLTKGKTSKEYLYNLCHAGLKKRLGDDASNDKVYLERLDYELEVINKMGYDDYFLIVWDFIKYAKNNKILVGPGRGSAAGSLVAYSIGISSVDPIKYGLYFERFLNPERVTMPDIDTDFPDIKREAVIDYVRNLYGADHVSSIGTLGTFKTKSSIIDIGRAMNKSDDFIKRVSGQIKTFLSNDDSRIDELINKIDNKEIKEFLYIASRIEGIPRHITTHASGVIVSNMSLYDLVPLESSAAGYLQTQFDAADCEEIGLLKMDFLGIKNLTIIDDILSKSKEYNNINVFNKVPLDDKKVYDMLSSGDTLGIFQLEKEGMRRTIKKLKPKNINDIIAVLALYRPGPMDNIDEYIERHNGKPYKNIHPDLDDILKETYGIIVYQEQIMQIARRFAGYSLGGADILRRAVSKKKEDILISEREKFVSSSIEKGYSKDIANKIYDDIVKFADYGFNKSHSVVYGLFAYIMAYFKANNKIDFIESILNSVIGSIEETNDYIIYARKNGIKIMPPDINISYDKYISKNGILYMPFNSIKGVGKNVSSIIVSERQNGYKSYDDFKTRTKLSSSVLESLVYSGAFDSIETTKRELIESTGSEADVIDSFLGKKKKNIEEFPISYLKAHELDALGINIKYNPFINADKLRLQYKAIPLQKFNNNISRGIVEFSDFREITTKNNKHMALGRVADDSYEYDMVIFSDVFNKYKGLIKKDTLFVIDGSLRDDKERGKSIIVEAIYEIKNTD